MGKKKSKLSRHPCFSIHVVCDLTQVYSQSFDGVSSLCRQVPWYTRTQQQYRLSDKKSTNWFYAMDTYIIFENGCVLHKAQYYSCRFDHFPDCFYKFLFGLFLIRGPLVYTIGVHYNKCIGVHYQNHIFDSSLSFYHPFHYLRLLFFSLSLPRRNSALGSLSGLFSTLHTMVRALPSCSSR